MKSKSLLITIGFIVATITIVVLIVISSNSKEKPVQEEINPAAALSSGVGNYDEYASNINDVTKDEETSKENSELKPYVKGPQPASPAVEPTPKEPVDEKETVESSEKSLSELAQEVVENSKTTNAQKQPNQEPDPIQEKTEVISPPIENVNVPVIVDETLTPSTPRPNFASLKINDQYFDYDEQLVTTLLNDNRRVLLYFHANWFPNCRATEKDILANYSQLPEDVVILKVNYDTEVLLRKRIC